MSAFSIARVTQEDADFLEMVSGLKMKSGEDYSIRFCPDNDYVYVQILNVSYINIIKEILNTNGYCDIKGDTFTDFDIYTIDYINTFVVEWKTV